MNLAIALHIESYALLALALAAAMAAALMAWRRRVRLPATSLTLIAMGMILLALAAGGLTWDRPKAGGVAVMVDLSASTRGARYRDRAVLDRRIAQLLGSTPYRVVFFAEQSRQSTSPTPLSDLPGDRTIFSPPPSGAVLLFSDGRFDLPAAGAPVFAVVDPALEETEDSAVERLEVRSGTVAARMRNQSFEPRHASVADERQEVGHGTMVLTRRVEPQQRVAAQVQGQDRWPENDSLALRVPPEIASERWWIGNGAPAGWRMMMPGELPIEAEAYLGASVIAVNNIAMEALPIIRQERLEQYVRDLGGGLLILGGDRAFAAGGYPGSRIEELSPLSSTPPAPAAHWILLADSSGSMAEPVGGTTRWEMVRRAIVGLPGQLPPADAITVGSFAQEVRWWSRGRSARETAVLSLPPADVHPHGPTNLQAALLSIIASAEGGMRKELLILSDADADLTDLDELAQGLVQRQIRLHLLDTYGKGRGLNALRELATKSGGQVVQELDPGKWVAAARKLAGQAAEDQLRRDQVAVRFSGELSPLASRAVDLWNHTWLKERAAGLAESAAQGERIPLAARWQQGLGRVAAVAFAPTSAEAEAIARLVEQRPADPRLRVTWDAASMLRVTIDAMDGQTYLNGLRMELEIAEEAAAARRVAIPQVAPGRYDLTIESPRRPAVATVWHEGRAEDRTAIAGRYAPEFDAIGNDRATLARLAARTSGRIVEPGSAKPIEFNWPRQRIALMPWLSAAGFLLMGAGLLWWRVR